MARRRIVNDKPRNGAVANGKRSTHETNSTLQPDTKNAPGTTPKHPRALSPDLLRGLLNMIMALDHTSLALRTFEHGTGLVLEHDGQVVLAFNSSQPYILRTLTHLCGPGFTFLLGMGTVYLVESRLRMGWSEGRVVRYLAVRMGILTALAVLMGATLTKGEIWMFNVVIFSLAVGYFVSGVLVLGIRRTERVLGEMLMRWVSSKGTVRPNDDKWAKDMSRRAHNLLLVILSIAAIWVNHWLSPDNGHCLPEGSTRPAPIILGFTITHSWLQMWFWPVNDREAHIMSGFPPFAWLSFSTFGVLYGRALASRPRSWEILVKSYVLLAAGFGLIFTLSRILNVGNLSEGCLQTLENLSQPERNQYLASWKCFFYIVKYPPDIAFCALTMSGIFLLLALFESIPYHIAKRLTLLTDLGTSALFFYLVHLTVIFLGGGMAADIWGEIVEMEDPMNPGVPQKGFTSMKVFWAAWGLLILITWPLCRWFSRFKAGKPATSLWRLF